MYKGNPITKDINGKLTYISVMIVLKILFFLNEGVSSREIEIVLKYLFLIIKIFNNRGALIEQMNFKADFKLEIGLFDLLRTHSDITFE